MFYGRARALVSDNKFRVFHSRKGNKKNILLRSPPPPPPPPPPLHPRCNYIYYTLSISALSPSGCAAVSGGAFSSIKSGPPRFCSVPIDCHAIAGQLNRE